MYNNTLLKARSLTGTKWSRGLMQRRDRLNIKAMGSNKVLALHSGDLDSNLGFFLEVQIALRLCDTYTFDHNTPNRKRIS